MSKELLAALDKLTAQVTAQGAEIAEIKRTKSKSNPAVQRVMGPYIRKGEDTMSSRPYSFIKALALYQGRCQPEQASVEYDVHNKIRKTLLKSGYTPEHDRMLYIPFWIDAFGDEEYEMQREFKSLLAFSSEIDQDEVRWLRKRYYPQHTKDLSWLNDTLGGSLVPAAAQGELIEYLRNKNAIMAAGAPTFPLPPQGSISFPKQTGAMTAYWLGEKQTITKSDAATGSVMLRAKKLAARGSIPNELFRYSNPAADAMVRNDIGMVLALALDLGCLEGTGGYQPTGLISGTGGQAILTYTASKTATDGNTFQPQDWGKMIGKVEDNNGIVNENAVGFICRPKFYRFADAARADAVSAGDAAGMFVEALRQADLPIKKTKAGYPVTTSNQVSGTRTKGSGTTLSYVIGGDWSQALIGMGPAMELDMNPWGDTQWQSDQTEIRGILQADFAHRHKESFVWCDQLLQA